MIHLGRARLLPSTEFCARAERGNSRASRSIRLLTSRFPSSITKQDAAKSTAVATNANDTRSRTRLVARTIFHLLILFQSTTCHIDWRLCFYTNGVTRRALSCKIRVRQRSETRLNDATRSHYAALE